MKKLYFVRHGLSQLGKEGLWAGSTDTPLAPEGHEQAKIAGQAALELGIGHIIASPLKRAYNTATIIAAEIDYAVEHIEVNKLVVERDFGPLEATAWNPEFDVEGIVGIESYESILDRARQTYAHLQTIEADVILVVSHGAFGRALRHIIHPETPFDKTGRLENAQIVQFI